jgi:hypothetical protein
MRLSTCIVICLHFLRFISLSVRVLVSFLLLISQTGAFLVTLLSQLFYSFACLSPRLKDSLLGAILTSSGKWFHFSTTRTVNECFLMSWFSWFDLILLTSPLGSSPAAMPHISLLGLQLPQAALQPASVQPPDSPEDKNNAGVMPSISGSKTVPTS